MSLRIGSHQPASVGEPGVLTHLGRYSVISAAPRLGQVDLLAETRVRIIPYSEKTVGDALNWLLKGSGYRLAESSVLPEEAGAMLHLPLPGAHCQFQELPLRQVISLIVGPAFTLVHCGT